MLRRLIVVLTFAIAGAVCALAQDPENCLYCHLFAGLSRFDPETERVRLFFVDSDYVHSQRGPHARLRCTNCHDAAASSVVPHGEMTPVDCSRTCHIVSANQPERRFSHANVARMLERSVHKPETFGKLEFSSGPLLNAGQSTCLYCHDEPIFRDPAGVIPRLTGGSDHALDRCEVCHETQVPLETGYFLRHVAARLQSARPPLEQAQICAVCHNDPKVVRDFSLPNSVASFVRSFHGKAALLGDPTTADCVSCHVSLGENAHLMLGPKEPHSAVHADNVADSCRSPTCHPGADPAFGAAAVHLDLFTNSGLLEYGLAVAFLFITLFSFGPSALIVMLELAQLVIGRHAHVTHELKHLAEKVQRHPDGPRILQRFTVFQRYEHWMLSALFIALCMTGFPMKFAEQGWATTMIGWFGGLGTARLVHHWAGIALVIGFAAHLLRNFLKMLRHARTVHADGRPVGLVRAYTALPLAITPTDLKKAGSLMAYLFGRSSERPLFGRFTVSEKFEYLGVAWGTTLLGITGLALWGEQIASHLLGGRVFNVALIIHTFEAFLAVIHVGILHMYNVLLNPAIFPLSPATLSGRTPATKLAEENGEFVQQAAEKLGITAEGSGA